MIKFKFITISIFALVIFSCTQTTTINLKKTSFNQAPKKIIWLQLAGLDEDLISYLSYKDHEIKKNSFENFTCFGMHWESNLFELYPPSSHVMRTLITGKENINGSCEDFSKKPFWMYLDNDGKSPYQVVVIEKSTDFQTSLLQAGSCDNKNGYWQIPFLIKFDDFHKKQFSEGAFSVLQRERFKEKGVYYDSSCMGDKCHNSLLNSLSYVVDELVRYKKNSILIVRDFSGEKLIKGKKIADWGKWLFEWNQAILYIQNTMLTSETLLLVTGVAPQLIRLPQPGQDMQKWLSNLNPTQLKDRSVYAKTWAVGARAENFCGMYKAEDHVTRLLWESEEKSILGFQ